MKSLGRNHLSQCNETPFSDTETGMFLHNNSHEVLPVNLCLCFDYLFACLRLSHTLSGASGILLAILDLCPRNLEVFHEVSPLMCLVCHVSSLKGLHSYQIKSGRSEIEKRVIVTSCRSAKVSPFVQFWHSIRGSQMLTGFPTFGFTVCCLWWHCQDGPFQYARQECKPKVPKE